MRVAGKKAFIAGVADDQASLHIISARYLSSLWRGCRTVCSVVVLTMDVIFTGLWLGNCQGISRSWGRGQSGRLGETMDGQLFVYHRHTLVAAVSSAIAILRG